MMRTITDPDGEKIVILTGRAAELVIENARRNPPPFEAVNYRPASAYDPTTRTTEPLFSPDESAIFDRLNREVLHYKKLEAVKTVQLSEAAGNEHGLRAEVEALRNGYEHDMRQAGDVIEQLRQELAAVGEQLSVMKLAAKVGRRKPGPKPKGQLRPILRAALPAANGKPKKK